MRQIFDQVNQIDGWFSDAEMLSVFDVVSKLPKDSLLVELGTWKGRSTLFFRLANPNIDIVTIDECVKFWTSPAPAAEIDPKVLSYPRITYIKSNTSDVAKKFNDPIDFVFVDTIHTYDGVNNDIKDWSDKVKVGGYMLFHDCHRTQDDTGLYKGLTEWLKASPDWVEVPLKPNVPMLLAYKVANYKENKHERTN